MKKYNFIIALLVVYGCKQEPKKNQSPTAASFVPVLQQLEKELLKKPDSIGLQLQLINALDSMQLYDKALNQVDLLIKKDSLNYGFWYRKGQLLSNAKDTVEAIKAYNYAAKIYPAPDALLTLGNLYAETKNKKALIFAKAVLDLRLGREYNAHSYFISGIYYARVHQNNEALQFFEKCIQENYTYVEAYLEKGFIFFDQQQYNDALKIFTMAANINNTYADAYYWQAKCYEVLHKNEEAIKNYELSLQLDTHLVEAEAALKRLK
jgi:tetratricopeptide (TPR) repeat protein